MQKRKSNTLGKAKSRGDIAKDVRRKAGDPTFRKIIKIVANTKKEELPALLAKIEVPKGKTFIVGEFFQHLVGGDIPQYHFDGFKNCLLNDAKDKVISVGEAIKNLSEYVLSQNMNDTAIQQNTKSNPIEEDTFWATLYVLLSGNKLSKDKVYFMHVQKKSGEVITFDIRWNKNDCKWCLNADKFGVDGWWSRGFVFLFPIISAKA